MRMNRDGGEAVALQALGWIAGNDDLLPVFLGATGVAPGELRSRLHEVDFLASVLDFLLMDDAWVMAFCDAQGLAYETPRQARMILPGAAGRDWA